MKNKYDYPLYFGKGKLEKGSMYGIYSTFNNEKNTSKRTIYNYFMTNNHFNIFLMLIFIGFFLSVFLLFLFDIPYNSAEQGSIYIFEKLGNNPTHKLSIFLTSFILMFVAGIKQLDYLTKTKSNLKTFILILITNFIIFYTVIYLYHVVFFNYYDFK